MRTRFIVNPRSGGATQALRRVQACAATFRAEVVLTTQPRHATALAHAALAAGCELNVAVGGDGTLNEVSSALVGTPATFGLVPCGSGNGLGRHLGIHGSVAHALDMMPQARMLVIAGGVAANKAITETQMSGNK